MSNVVPADTGLLLGFEISMHARPRCPPNKPPVKPLGLVLQCTPHVSRKADPKPTHKHDCHVAACFVGSALTSPLFPESLHTPASVSWSLRAHPKPQKVQACRVSGLSGREADRHVPVITVGAPPPGQALGVCPVSPETRAFPGKSARCPSAVMLLSSESSQGVTSLGAVGGRPCLLVFPSLHQVCCVSQGSQGNPCPMGLITPSRAQSLWGLTGLLPAPVPPPCSLPHLSFIPQPRPPTPCLPDLATAPAQSLHLQVHSPRALHSGARSLLKGHLGN